MDWKSDLLVFLIVQFAMIATALWESRIEGKNIGASKQVGWKRNLFGLKFTEYHFWLWVVAYPLIIIAIPLAAKFSWHLLVVLCSAYLIGVVLEDFMWFAVNPMFPLQHFNPESAKWYPWIKIWKIKLPFFYPMFIILSAIVYLLGRYFRL